MNRRVQCLSLALIVSSLLSGCGECRTLTIGDPAPIVRCLIERNILAGAGEGALRSPVGKEWDRLRLGYFPGGVAVDWASTMEVSSPLVFDASGAFVCRAIQYTSARVTGVDSQDVVTAEWIGLGIGFVVHRLDQPKPRGILLGSMSKYAYSLQLFPAIWDFDDDGVSEIICRLPSCSLPKGAGIDLSRLKGESEEWLVTVWSLRGGTPRIVLAFTDCEYHAPGGWYDGLYVEGRKIEWDARARRFAVPDLAHVRVLVNEGL